MLSDLESDSEVTMERPSPPPNFRRIGQGFCGSVWAVEGGKRAMKREDGGPGRSLLNDYNMHNLVLENASASHEKISVCIPRWPYFIKEDDSPGWWESNLSRFPAGYTRCNILSSECIPAFGRDVRNRLIDKYCPLASVAIIKANDADRDCLVRPYLGRRKIQNEARRGLNFFSLRNFPLHLNQAKDLDLPVVKYAHAMAEMLAMMHWKAKIDANDIEFVLGGIQPEPDAGSTYTHSFLGTHSLWVLDFDCCKPIEMNEAGIGQAARAFLRNDPFFPRPPVDGDDSALWVEFRDQYLECSKRFVDEQGDDCFGLPEMFIAQVVERTRQRVQS